MLVKITSSAPTEYKALVWDIFFRERARGISLHAHFPWLDEHDTWYSVIEEQGQVVAGLAVRRTVSRSNADLVAGAIGLVCVDNNFRGQGYSKAALLQAIIEAKRRKYDDLLLWTGKPDLYKKIGFVPYDESYFGWVFKDDQVEIKHPNAHRSEWPFSDESASELRGIPPFALNAIKWRAGEASIVIVEDLLGPIVTEWSGDYREVCALLGAVMPKKWRINVLHSDVISRHLLADGWKLNLELSMLQMAFNLNSKWQFGDPYKFRLMDRI